MRLLLDTHVFLWWRANDARVRPIADVVVGADRVCVSAASAWEVAIKVALGKLKLPPGFAAGVTESGFEPLAITFDHAERVQTLPLRHRDPFDRMLVAQAMQGGLTLVTADAAIQQYDEVDVLAL